MDQHFDLHKQGLFVIISPDGQFLTDTCSTTGYSAISTFVRKGTGPWAGYEAKGYTVGEFSQVAVVSKTRPAPEEVPVERQEGDAQ